MMIQSWADRIYVQVNVTIALPAAGYSWPVSTLVTVMDLPSASHFLLALVTAICWAPEIPPRTGEATAEV